MGRILQYWRMFRWKWNEMEPLNVETISNNQGESKNDFILIFAECKRNRLENKTRFQWIKKRPAPKKNTYKNSEEQCGIKVRRHFFFREYGQNQFVDSMLWLQRTRWLSAFDLQKCDLWLCTKRQSYTSTPPKSGACVCVANRTTKG